MRDKLMLSIGLIVKNEEKCLEKCLQSLQPLLQQVPSELIIADTGSTDKTPDIARQYTDNFYHFEWCNDFAKARNFVLDKCSGSWFLQIDADENFEKTDAIIHFFQTSECDAYNDASIIVRNYLGGAKSNYVDFYLGRMFRRAEGRRYQGTIHECVPQIGPVKFFDEHLNHFGYTKSGDNKKSDRNLPPLLKEVKNNPKDTRLLYQLVQEYINLEENDKAKEICKKILYRKNYDKDDIFITYAANTLMGIYFSENKYEEVLKEGKHYLFLKMEVQPERLNILNKMTNALIFFDYSQETKKYFQEYFSLVDFFQKKIDDGVTGIVSRAEAFKKEVQELKRYQWIQVLVRYGDYSTALDELVKVTGILGKQRFTELVNFWVKATRETGYYDEFYNYYQLVKQDNKKREFLNELMMSIWDKDTETAKKMGRYLIPIDIDEFGKVQQVMIDMADKNSISEEELTELCRSIPAELYYHRLIFLALKYGTDVKSFLDRCTYDKLLGLADTLMSKNQDTADLLISGTVKLEQMSSICERIFISRLEENLVFNVNLVPSQIKDFFIKYVKYAYSVLEEFYKPCYLDEKNCKLLPGRECFIIYSMEAVKSKEKGDLKNFLLYLREGIKYYEPMAEIIKILTEDIREEIKEEKETKKEFNMYGEKVKSAILNLIIANRVSDAKEILEAYEKINPMDPDIEKLKRKIRK